MHTRPLFANPVTNHEWSVKIKCIVMHCLFITFNIMDVSNEKIILDLENEIT